MFAPTVVGLRDSSTTTARTSAPGDEVFRAMVIGADAIVNENHLVFDMEYNAGLKYLTEFAQTLDEKFWERCGFKTDGFF